MFKIPDNLMNAIGKNLFWLDFRKDCVMEIPLEGILITRRYGKFFTVLVGGSYRVPIDLFGRIVFADRLSAERALKCPFRVSEADVAIAYNDGRIKLVRNPSVIGTVALIGDVVVDIATTRDKYPDDCIDMDRWQLFADILAAIDRLPHNEPSYREIAAILFEKF